MAIKDLQARQGNAEVLAEVIDKAEVREFEKFGKSGRVCNAKIRDDTGEVQLTLWNEQVDQVAVGDKVHISNGWVGEFQGELQLSTGKFGKLEVTKGAGAATSDNEVEAAALNPSQHPPPSQSDLTPDETEEAASSGPKVEEERVE
jgi:replication factor A1|tara:strand:- start:1575 stop:2012 length:438 start_codon:yes stop_codon:yes gene_type:complete